MKFVLALILAGSVCQSFAGEWNQFLGPNRNGAVTAGDRIPANPKLNLAWSRDLGSGYSGVLVSNGRLFTMHKQGKNDVMTCMKADTGETVWQYDIAPFFPKVGSAPGGALSTPALDKEQVYGLGARGEFFALKRDSGKQVWKVHLKDELGGVQPGVGFTTSPLVIGNRVIVQIGNTDGKSIGAFDTKSGKLVWSSGTGAVTIQSPSLVEFLGQSYLISLHGNGISGLDPETGKVLWNHDGKAGIQVLPTGKDSFLINITDSGYVHYQLTQKDKTIVLKELWSNDILNFLYDIPVVHDGLAFGFKNGIVTCLNLGTGERAWQERMPAGGVTTVVDGHLVIWCNGEIRLVKASDKAYEEVALIKIVDGEERDSYTIPSYANGHFYVRNLTKIAAVKVST
jgi:outer membrane protein assembly factor BamB